MSKKLDGRVIKAVASKFYVETPGGVKVCFARKKLKAFGNILVGDFVSIEKERDSFVISAVMPRKNALIRPYVANIDVCLIVLASEPEPDFTLADKIIVNCLKENVEPVLVNNKSDIEKLDFREYNGVSRTVVCSAETGEGLRELVSVIKGKTVCLAGQSAVGKSSLINALAERYLLEVGSMAKKVRRGRHTTRQTEIISLGEGTYVVDTCGFSLLEAVDISPEELRLYYDDFEKYRMDCRFNTCTHTDEPDCAVKARVGFEIGEGRYARYKIILNELNERREKKYD